MTMMTMMLELHMTAFPCGNGFVRPSCPLVVVVVVMMVVAAGAQVFFMHCSRAHCGPMYFGMLGSHARAHDFDAAAIV